MDAHREAFRRSIRAGEGVREALGRLVNGWDAGKLRCRHRVEAADQESWWTEVNRDGHVSRRDFCTALAMHFRNRPELHFSPEEVFDASFIGNRAESWLPATVAAAPAVDEVNVGPTVQFAWGEREEGIPLAHVRAKGSSKREPALPSSFIVGQQVEAQLRRVSLNDVAALLAPREPAATASGVGGAGSAEAAAGGRRFSSVAGVDAAVDTRRREQLAHIVRRRDRPARMAGAWFEGQGAFAAALTANNAAGDGAGTNELYQPSDPTAARAVPDLMRAGGVSLQRLTPIAGGLSDDDNRIDFPHFLGALKRYLGEDTAAADHGPQSESVECRIPFLPRDARLLFDCCAKDARGRASIADLAALVLEDPTEPAVTAATAAAATRPGRRPPPPSPKVCASAPFYTNESTSNSRTWGSNLGGGRGDGWLAGSAKIGLRARCSDAVGDAVLGGATAAAQQQPILTLLRCLKRALRPGQMHRGALAATLSAFEEPFPSKMKRVLPVLKTEISVVGQHKTGWMLCEELLSGMRAMLPHQDTAMVRAGVVALFEQLSQEMPVDDHRRIMPLTEEQQRSALQPQTGPTQATQVLDLIHVDALCSWMARQLAKKDLLGAAQSSRASPSQQGDKPGARPRQDAQSVNRGPFDARPDDEVRLAALLGRLRRRAPPGAGMAGLHEALGGALAAYDQVSRLKTSAGDGELDFDVFYRALRGHVGLNQGMAYTHTFHQQADVPREDAQRLFDHYATANQTAGRVDPARVQRGLGDPRKLSTDRTASTVSKPAARVANAIRLLRRRTPRGATDEETLRRAYGTFATRAHAHADAKESWLTCEQFSAASRLLLGHTAEIESSDLDLLFYHVHSSRHNTQRPARSSAPQVDGTGDADGLDGAPGEEAKEEEVAPKPQRNFYHDTVGGEREWPPPPAAVRGDEKGARAAGENPKVSLLAVVRCIETPTVSELSRRQKLGLSTQGWQSKEDLLATAAALAAAKPADAFQV